MERNRIAFWVLLGLASVHLFPARPADAQILEGLNQQAESAVVQKGGEVIREAIDCAVGDPQCQKLAPSPTTPPDAAQAEPAPAAETPPASPEHALPASTGPAPAAQPPPAPAQGFSATVSPWITRDTQGWDHMEESVTFTGDAVFGVIGDKDQHQLLLCDQGRKWKGTFGFFAPNGVSDLKTREYTIVTRWGGEDEIYPGGFFMPLATRFKEGSVTLDSVGSGVVAGTARATYTASPYLRLESGSAPETHEVVASFRARVLPEITEESAPACFWP